MEDEKSLKINQESMDVLVANVIPTTKYFETRFDHMQYQIDELKNAQTSMQKSIDRRFDTMQKDIDTRFDTMQKDIDERFEQVDKRFERVENSINKLVLTIEKLSNEQSARIEKLSNEQSLKIEKLTSAQETTIRDYIIERDRFYDRKFTNLRMYNIAIIALVSGVILKMAGIIQL